MPERRLARTRAAYERGTLTPPPEDVLVFLGRIGKSYFDDFEAASVRIGDTIRVRLPRTMRQNASDTVLQSAHTQSSEDIE